LEITLTIAGTTYRVDISEPLDISIPVRFHGPQPSVFHAPPATSEPFQEDGFIGSVSRGGSCNCETHTFVPHTSGSHTECVGHISEKPISVPDVLKNGLFPATLITLQSEEARNTAESYTSALLPGDRLLTSAMLEACLHDTQPDFLQALVIRTLPNSADKLTENYDLTGSAFFSTEAMNSLVQRGVQHLLVDIPSVDRLHDEGRLGNHHIFWDLPQGSRQVEKRNASPRTITELIYVPTAIADGQYLLNLQLAPLLADAAPSRPTLYKVHAL